MSKVEAGVRTIGDAAAPVAADRTRPAARVGRGARTRLIWSFAIGTRDEPSMAKGYVLAPTEEAALALVGHPEGRVWPYPGRSWPGPEGEILCTILDPYGLVGQRRTLRRRAG